MPERKSLDSGWSFIQNLSPVACRKRKVSLSSWRTHSCVPRSHSCERISDRCLQECKHGTEECVRHEEILTFLCPVTLEVAHLCSRFSKRPPERWTRYAA